MTGDRKTMYWIKALEWIDDWSKLFQFMKFGFKINICFRYEILHALSSEPHISYKPILFLVPLLESVKQFLCVSNKI